MKHVFSLMAISAIALAASAQTPEPKEFSDYTGTTFKANFEQTAGARLSVFSLNEESTKTETMDFSSVIKDSRIDPDAVAAIGPEWGVGVKNPANVATVDGKQMLLLSDNGDGVSVVSRKGFLKSIVVKARLVNANGINNDNASYLTIDILLNDGSRMGMKGTTYVSLFDALDSYDFCEQILAPGETSTVSGVRIAVEKDTDHKVGDVVLESISYEYDEREYLLRDVAVSGESHLVEGCDPAKAYFYYLSPAQGDSQSAIETADGFVTPELTEPVVTSTTSYKATWATAHKAETVAVANYKVTTFTEPTQVYVINDDFDNAGEGTVEEPVKVTDIDDFTENGGWMIADGAAIIADGMIGTAGSPRPWPPMGGYIYTPALDLSAANGVYTISARFIGEPGDVLSIYRENSMTPDYQLYGQQFTFDENGVIEKTWTIDDGVADRSIHIESKGMKKFMIDYFRISQTMAAGSVIYTPAGSAKVDVDATSHEFTGLEEGATYAWALLCTGHDIHTRERSAMSPVYRHVDLSNSGLAPVVAEAGVLVTTDCGSLSVTVAADCAVAVYDFRGNLLGSAAAAQGTTVSFSVASGTPVIVTAGARTAKLIVR